MVIMNILLLWNMALYIYAHVMKYFVVWRGFMHSLPLQFCSNLYNYMMYYPCFLSSHRYVYAHLQHPSRYTNVSFHFLRTSFPILICTQGLYFHSLYDCIHSLHLPYLRITCFGSFLILWLVVTARGGVTCEKGGTSRTRWPINSRLLTWVGGCVTVSCFESTLRVVRRLALVWLVFTWNTCS